jgi:hypothetical protein
MRRHGRASTGLVDPPRSAACSVPSTRQENSIATVTLEEVTPPFVTKNSSDYVRVQQAEPVGEHLRRVNATFTMGGGSESDAQVMRQVGPLLIM